MFPSGSTFSRLVSPPTPTLWRISNHSTKGKETQTGLLRLLSLLHSFGNPSHPLPFTQLLEVIQDDRFNMRRVKQYFKKNLCTCSPQSRFRSRWKRYVSHSSRGNSHRNEVKVVATVVIEVVMGLAQTSRTVRTIVYRPLEGVSSVFCPCVKVFGPSLNYLLWEVFPEQKVSFHIKSPPFNIRMDPHNISVSFYRVSLLRLTITSQAECKTNFPNIVYLCSIFLFFFSQRRLGPSFPTPKFRRSHPFH